jgi:uncharacterized protein (DUF2062 family)
MPKRLFKRYLPNPSAIREHPALRPVSRWLHEPDLWHMNRRSVSGAMLIGLFCAFLPIPFQMLVAAALGVAARCNLAVCIMLVWLTNPLTMPPVMFLSYEVGAWLLNRHVATNELSLDWQWLWDHMGDIGYPLLAGSLFLGAVSGLAGYVIVRISWRLHIISRWRLRRDRRRLQKLLRERDPGAS